MANILIPDLLPNTQYVVEVRAVRSTGTSEWSNRAFFTTVSDTVLPLTPTTVTWAVSGDSFAGSWDTMSTNVNGEVITIVRYEVELVANTLTRIISVPQTTAGTIYYNLSYEDNRQLFNTPQATVQMRVRAVSNIDTKSAWSAPLSVSNPVPGAPTGVTATAGNNQIGLTWTPPSDTDIIGYNVYFGATKLTFVNATSWTYYTTSYSATTLTVKSVDKFNQESTGANSNSVTPLNPSTVDTTAPNTPTGLTATITNNANGIGARAAVSWTMTSPPSDLAGYYIRYRKVGDTNYSNVTFSKDVLAGTIELQSAYTNYEFQIKAFDWSQNESAWSATVTATSPSNAAPANVTGLTATPGRDSITYNWTAVADTDIKNYEVTFSTSSTFASGNTTFLTGSATTLTVGGLAPSTTYYARVRAVDTSGNTSAAWSSTNTSATTAFPAATSDGYAPQNSPTPTVAGGLSYLYITWSPTTLNSNGGTQVDPVTYEVHLSTTTGFTTSSATKVTEVSGTSAIIDNLPGTQTPLSYGTTYYIKLVAKDRDGSAASGTQGNGQISKVASTDVTSIGADLIVPGTGFVNALIINSGGSIQSSNYNTTNKTGFKIDNTGIDIQSGSVRASTLIGDTLTSSTGAINIGTGASIILNGGYIKSNTYTGTAYSSSATAGFYLGNDGLVIAQGTVKAEAFAGGTFTAGTITMGAGGSITGGSWTLNSSGLTIPNGAISAAALNIQIGANLIPAKYADFEGPASSYPAFPTVLGIGASSTAVISTTQAWNNSQALYLTNTSGGTRGRLLATSQTDYNIKLDPSTRYIISAYIYNDSGTTQTGYFGVKQQDATYVNALSQTYANTAGWVRYSAAITTTSAANSGMVTFTMASNGSLYLDGFQIEKAVNGTVTTPSPWAPPGSTKIDGALIRTGAIQSTALGLVWDDATGGYIDGTQPAWSIDTGGDATFTNVNVLGSISVGDPADVANSYKYVVGSVAYEPGVAGWIMHGDGQVEFNQIISGSIDGDAIRAGTLSVDKLTGGQIGANGQSVDIQIVGGGGISIYKFGDDPTVAGTLPIIKLNPSDGLVIDPPGVGSITVPATSGQPISIKDVSLTATDATFNGNVQIYGTNNYISGDMVMEKAISAPIVAPTVSSGWSDTSTYLQAATPAGWQTFGLAQTSDGTKWMTGIFNGSNDVRLYSINKTTGAVAQLVSNPTIQRIASWPGYYSVYITANPNGVRGVARILVGATWYHAMLIYYPAQSGTVTTSPSDGTNSRVTKSYSFAAEWRVQLYLPTNTNGASPNVSWNLPSLSGYNLPHLTSDDTSFFLGLNKNTSPYQFQVNRYDYNGANGAVLSTSASGYASDITSVYAGTADFAGGVTRYLVGGSGSTYYALPAGTSVANDTTIAFDRANNENAWGILWDGTQFRSINNSGKIYKYSTYAGADTATTWSYSWYDTDNSSTGILNADRGNYTHMTLPSPSSPSYTIKRRGWTKFSVSTSIPDGGGTDDPDSIKVFVNYGSGIIPQPNLGSGITSNMYSSYVTTTPVGEIIPTRNEFDDVSKAGSFTSKATDTNGSLISLKGDGSGRVGGLRWNADGTSAEPWIVVGSGGSAPGFQNGWVSHSDAVNYPDLGSVAFTKDGSWTVLRGYTKSGVAGTAFTLPVGYRPEKEEWFASTQGIVSGDPRLAFVRVKPDGSVVVALGNTYTAGASLFGIRFRRLAA